MKIELTEKYKELLSEILLFDKKERDELFEECLNDMGITGFKAKAAVKFIIPMLQKAITGYMTRGGIRLNDWMQSHSQSYDQFVNFLCRRLLLKVKHKLQTSDAINKHLRPIRELVKEVESFNEFPDQEKVWIAMLAQLNLLVVSIGEFKTNPILRLEQPKKVDLNRPSRLLRPYNDFVPLVGRDNEISILNNFCLSKMVFSWIVITGDGGIGKTRLAQYFAKKMGNDGWHAGFLNECDLDNLVSSDKFNRWEPFTDTLIVIDYAASKADSLHKLIQRAAAVFGDNPDDVPEEVTLKFRLLLLERHGKISAGWLRSLFQSGEGSLKDYIQDAFHSVVNLRPPLLKDLDIRTSMMRIFRDTVQGYAKLSGAPAPHVPELDDIDLRMLFTHTEGKPLFIQIAGLHFCEYPDASQLILWGKNDLLSYAVDKEETHIENLCKCYEHNGKYFELICRTVALHFLARPEEITDQRWFRFIKNEWSAFGYDQCEPGRVSQFLIEVMGDGSTKQQGGISPITPNLIGAYFLYKQLTSKDLQLNRTVSLKRVINYAGLNAWNQLLLAVRDLYMIPGCKDVNQWLLPLLTELNSNDLMGIAKLIPIPSVSLANFSLEVYSRLYDSISKIESNEPLLAYCLNILAFLHYNAGNIQEALAPAEHAVEIYTRLAKKMPSTHEASQAMSLNTLTNLYGSVSREQEALPLADLAVSIFERLVKKNPKDHEPDYAKCLNTQANLYSKVGLTKESLKASEHAADIYMRLAEQNRDAYEPDWAMILHNLADRYFEVGRKQESLEKTKRAVDIYTRLAKLNPDSYEPYYGRSLITLANLNFETGRQQESLDPAKRAVNIYARLAKLNSDAYDPYWARSLDTLANIYSEIGRQQESLEPAELAVNIYTRLVKLNPDTYKPYLAMSLNNLAKLYCYVSKQQDALPLAEQSVDIYTQLVKQHNTCEPDLASSLSNLASIYYYLDRVQEAMERAEQSVNIYKLLVKLNHDAYEYKFSCSLSNLAAIYYYAGKQQEALAPAEQAVNIFRRLTEQDPDSVFEPHLASSLKMLAKITLKQKV